MQVGIVGLPNAGKSTLFNALTAGHALAESYPFSTIEPNLGRVTVPDLYLHSLQDIFASQKATPVSIEFVDIAGLVEGAHKGEGLGNQFLAHIRQVEALVHVLRSFSSGDVAHVRGKLDPSGDLMVVEMELMYADLAVLSRRLEKIYGYCKSGEKEYLAEQEVLQAAQDFLNDGKPLREMELEEKAHSILADLNLLTLKPVLYLINGSLENQEGEKLEEEIRRMRPAGSNTMIMDAQMEAEVAQLPEEEAQEFLADLDLQPALDRFVEKAYSLLELIKFYTGNKNEVRAWNIKRNASLIEAAAKVHTDMARGFIKGEVIPAPTLVKLQSWSKAREKGLIRIEGRDYGIEDLDTIYIHFR